MASKSAKVIFWACPVGDDGSCRYRCDRDSACSVWSAENVSNPTRVARAFEGDLDDEEAEAAADALRKRARSEGYLLRTGHGVTVIYASGQQREIRRDW